MSVQYFRVFAETVVAVKLRSKPIQVLDTISISSLGVVKMSGKVRRVLYPDATCQNKQTHNTTSPFRNKTERKHSGLADSEHPASQRFYCYQILVPWVHESPLQYPELLHAQRVLPQLQILPEYPVIMMDGQNPTR